MLPNRVMVGWRPAHDKSFPTPRGDELVVFEDYFYGGFGVPIHLGLNSILHVSIVIISTKPILAFSHILISSTTFLFEISWGI